MNLDGVRERVVNDFGSDFVTYNIKDNPVTFKDYMASSEAKQGKKTVKSKMDSVVSIRTWVLIDLPSGCTTIGCKWIFKKKLKPDGIIEKFKARLVAKSFKQNEGIDYFDTYSPVPRFTIIRVLIALALVYNLPIHQMNVKTAFSDGITISQFHYVEKIIEKFGYQNSRIAKAPYDSSIALFKNESGVLVAQLRVLRYLKGTISLSTRYGRFPTVLEGYSDTGWIAKNCDSNGCSGYVFTLSGGAVS
ncbi:UNVERIFIED_CONTAM: hypothetical protein Scaly_0601200 [Sesamum calycinum]|uniref:Reverse transcriptase Ty1/copia-type domain-containing protein n=1 Tax=Sesamum calycinum TaxID=2727403 RepID=A0AAW2RST3_9LAMI